MDRDRHRRVRALLIAAWACALVLLAVPAIAGGEVVAIDGISLPKLTGALKQQPVQQVDQPDPALIQGQLGALRTLSTGATRTSSVMAWCSRLAPTTSTS